MWCCSLLLGQVSESFCLLGVFFILIWNLFLISEGRNAELCPAQPGLLELLTAPVKRPGQTQEHPPGLQKHLWMLFSGFRNTGRA